MIPLNREWFDRATVLSLCVLILTLPFSKTALEISFIAAFFSWVLSRSLFCGVHPSSQSPFKPTQIKLDTLIFIFVFGAVASIPSSASMSLSLKGLFFKLLKGVMLYFIIADVVNSRKRVNLILVFMFSSMALMCVDGLFQRITGWDFLRRYRITGWEYMGPSAVYRMRISASFFNPNGFGAWLTVMTPIALCATAINKEKIPVKAVKYFVWILTSVLMLCLAMTYSDGALVGFIFAAIFIAVYRKNGVILMITALLFSLLFFVIPYCINIHTDLNKLVVEFKRANSWDGALPVVKNLFFSIKNHLVQIMLKMDIIRTNLWREALMIIKNYPVFGAGLNTYSIVAPRFKSDASVAGIYPHNSYLQMAAETGIIGLTSFILLIIGLFRTSLRNLHKIKNSFYSNILLGLLAGLFGFLAHSFFDVHFYALQLANLMWFIMGLIIAVQKIALEEQGA